MTQLQWLFIANAAVFVTNIIPTFHAFHWPRLLHLQGLSVRGGSSSTQPSSLSSQTDATGKRSTSF